MAQYTTFADGETLVLTDGQSVFRVRCDTEVLYFDQALNAHTGFAGSENVDWAVVDSAAIGTAFDGTTFRVGVRDANWVIDQTYLPEILLFTGTEGLDWDNIEKHQL